MAEFVCGTCGERFDLSPELRRRYPGWTPRECRRCWSQRSDPGPDGGGGSRRTGAVEEDLTLDEVLTRYTAGPTSGVFTDGAASPNPGPGGWGAVYVVDDAIVASDHGHEEHTTNNRMELAALIAGCDLVPADTAATVYTDSRLCFQTITEWAPGWERRGWRRKRGEIANLDLVKAVYRRFQERPELRLEWISAHSGNRWNEYADALATAYRRERL